MKRGRFVTFEGIDGAGKSSHVGATARWLRAQGYEVLETREPGGTELAEAIRALVLAHEMAPLTEVLMVFAARHDHIRKVILPALGRGAWVVCDRFTDSSVAYQGDGRGLSQEVLTWLAAQVHPDVRPDRTYWFDVSPSVAAQRVRDRADADRFESEQAAFFERVAAGYARIARGDPARVRRIDGGQSRASIAGFIARDLASMTGRGAEDA